MASVKEVNEGSSTPYDAWLKRLKAAQDNGLVAPIFFDKVELSAPKVHLADGEAAFIETSSVNIVELRLLKEAALKFNVAVDTVLLATWSILLRSYAGDDVTNTTGVYLFDDEKAWLSTMPVSIEQGLLETLTVATEHRDSTMSPAEQSLGSFGRKNGYSFIPTSVCVCSGNISASKLTLPSIANIYIQLVEGGSVEARLSFHRDALSTEKAISILDNFSHTLKGVVQTSALTKDEMDSFLVRDIDTVSDNDCRRVVELSAPIPATFHATVHDLVLKRCAQPGQSDKVAIAAWDGNFTYAELAREVTTLAGQVYQVMQQYADMEQIYIPFCLTKSKWTPVAMLAIFAAGAAAVPLEPSHPPERRNGILNQVTAKIVITNKKLKEGLATSFAGETAVEHIICVDDERNQEDGTVSDLPVVRPDQLAYVIFTSGSTGTPKGVQWWHLTLASSIREYSREYHMEENPRVLQFASHVFDVSVCENLTALVTGGTTCIPSDEARTEPEQLALFMEEYAVDWAFFTPSFARLLRPESVPTLKTLVLGGESIGQDNIERWTPYLDQFIICYGPAETCIFCAKNEFSVATKEQKPWKESLGNSMSGRMLLSDHSNPDKLVPVGAIGEIIVEGPIVAKGYLNDPVKTAKSFIENPRWTQRAISPAETTTRRFYRTGDLGRQNMDGTITFYGRADFQVKLRGQRMELGEVQFHIMKSLPEAVDAHVDIITPGGGQKALAAFIAFAPNSDSQIKLEVQEIDEILAGSVRSMVDHLREALPVYSVPSFFIPLTKFPYMVSRKVERRRLLAFANEASVDDLASYNSSFLGGSSSSEESLEPETEMETEVLTCCQEVLGIASLNITDNFFAVGGDSVRAIKVAAAARSRRINLRVADIFRTPNLRALAKLATKKDDGVDAAEEIEGPPANFSLLPKDLLANVITSAIMARGNRGDAVLDAYPCTPQQEGLMTLSSMRDGLYTGQYLLELPDHVDIDRFKSAWEAVVKRNDILRTRILETFAGAVQAVYDSKIEWHHDTDLQRYLAKDMEKTIVFGELPVRWGLVNRTFVFTIHHATFDGMSLDRIWEDVEREYIEIEQLPLVQFKSFVRHISKFDFEESKQYWMKQFETDVGFVASHYPQINSSSSHDSICDARIVYDMKVKESHKSGFTMPTQIRAAWALMVGRLLDSKDVVFGETNSGRTTDMKDVDVVAGPTIATMPHRVKLDFDESVASYLQRLQEHMIEVTSTGYFGMQNASKLSPAANEACQFQHIIVIQPKKSSTIGNQVAEGVRPRIGLNKSTTNMKTFINYPLNVDFALGDDGNITITSIFDSRLLTENQINRLHEQFSYILNQICRLQDLSQHKVAEIEYTSLEDRKVQLEQNSDALEHERVTLMKKLSQHAADHPDSPAIESWDGSMTYAELHQASEVVARHLLSIGVQKGDYVPYCFPKSKWAAVSILATLMVEAISVALEPSHPDSSILTVLSKIDSKQVLTSGDLSARLQSMGQNPVVVDDNLVAEKSSAALDAHSVEPDDTAFVVFTSGSTGEPKGILLGHSAVCIMAKQQGIAMNINRDSRILQFSAYVFDVSIGDLATSIFYGACLCIPSDHDRLNNLAYAIQTFKANRAWLTPTVASLISPEECPSIEWLSVGGEQLTQHCKDIWASIPVVNVYGPAEVTNIGTAVTVTPDLPLVNIGGANGTRVWICEPGDIQRLAPVGCIGEIVFEGPNVSKGYLNNQELTEKAFPVVQHWESQEPTRVYRTGDLALLNQDGSLDFKGRKDTQIKLRGQRIEITAIEGALQKAISEPVELAVDVLAGDEDGSASLAAFLYLPKRLTGEKLKHITDKNTSIFSSIDLKELSEALRKQLAATLPRYMIPTSFIPLNRLPKLVSGKIDRKALRISAADLGKEKSSGITREESIEKRQPTTDEEKVMRKLWAAALRLEECDIGIDDDFLSLGGDSITAIRLVAQARAQGLSISVMEVFDKGSITRLCGTTSDSSATSTVDSDEETEASSIDTSEDLADLAAQCGVEQKNIEDVYPCTALQEGLLMMTEKNPSAYTAHHTMLLSKCVDLDLFRQAWELVNKRHAILRTRIVPSGVQVVLRDEPLIWTETSSNDLELYMQQCRESPMGFGTKLTRQAILSSPTRFVWTAHHSVYDGWSMALLAEALTQAYEEVSSPAGASKSKSAEGINFKAFAEHVSNINSEAAQKFWQEQLDGAEPAGFPPSLPSSYEPLADSTIYRDIPFVQSRKAAATTSSVIRAAWAILISTYTGSSTDVVFGSVVTGRGAFLEGVLDLIGPTLATVPVRVKLNPKQRIKDLLVQVQRQSFAMLEYEQYGLQNIAKSTPAAAAACKLQSLLVVHAQSTTSETSTSPESFSWGDAGTELDFLTSAVTLECQPTESTLKLMVSFDSKITDERQIDRLLQTFEHIIQQLLEGDDRLKLEDIEGISPADRREIAQINGELPVRVSECVHDMFERQAEKTPDAVAVSAWDGEFTYGELDELSTKLSVHLRSIGVGPDRFVPFCFEKSKWVPVALLGILKAGGACVPLDPAQPLDRLYSIIDTLAAHVVLTSATHRELLKESSGLKHFVEVSEAALSEQRVKSRSQIPRGGKPLTPESACYAIFTSGSTGTPKGVVWEHAALCTSITEHGAAFNYSPETRVLQFSSHTFDVSVSELLTTLMFGGCVCIPDDFTRLNDIAGFMNAKKVNWTFFAPSFARLLDPEKVPGLKTLVLGGEPAGKDNIEKWSGRSGLELIVTYGPAESCIYCAKNSVSGPQIDGSIGHSIGGTMWIADQGQPTKLAPIGAIGEIVVEGNILARHYLKDPVKTAAAFHDMPLDWANGRSSRIYRTGDLGRINSDGTISCLGRKDDQVKIRGQRVELSDIEYHLSKDEDVRQAVVLYPREGASADHLVAVVSMAAYATPSNGKIEVSSSDQWASVAGIQDRLAQKVPAYMVPSVWIVLKSIPLMPASQKANRKQVREWMKAMEHAQYEAISRLSAGSSAGDTTMGSNLEEKVRQLWSAILNVQPGVIGPNTSFLRLGGDSISAMQIVARCRNEGINVTVQDLLKTKTIAEFCKRAQVMAGKAFDLTSNTEDETDAAFPLSPIQSLFMELAPRGENHFNQSHLLHLTEAVEYDQIQKALLAIVQRHPMLRSRFRKNGSAWEQSISQDVSSSLQCRLFEKVTMRRAALYSSEAQESLDISKGPILAADVYKMTDGRSALFITCHHLAIDLVSWRIIFQELEEILKTGKLATERQPLSFRTWSRLLKERSESLTTKESTIGEVPKPDFDFWGTTSSENTAGHVIEESFKLDKATTQLLLGKSNDAMTTEPLDLLLTAVTHSFNEIFHDVRSPITVFNEGHGREPWSSDLDLSSTVGWFTSMSPVVLPAHDLGLLRSLQQVKDFRRRLPEKGLPYFTSFALNTPSALEVTFNYFGLYQQLERENALFNRMSWPLHSEPPDSAADIPRFSLFDISAAVENGILTMNFAYSDLISHQDLVQQWIEACSETLSALIKSTSEQKGTTLTLSDLPRLSLSYDELAALLSTTLAGTDVPAVNIQDIYPASPMQQALLMGQAVDSSLYAVRYVWEAISMRPGDVSLDKIVDAWKEVVQQHPMLRTVFLQANPVSGNNEKQPSVYNQVVLKEVEPSITICDNATTFPTARGDILYGKTPHHLAVYQKNSGSVLIQLDISHTLIDGTSVNLLLDHFIKAYDGDLTTSPGEQECYGNYVSYLGKQDTSASLDFWKSFLEGTEPCQFPMLQQAREDSASPARELKYLEVLYPRAARLHAACTLVETTPASIYKLAWALVLRAYTGESTPCFGYLASGRDLPVDGIEDSIGPFINMLVSRVSLEDDSVVVQSLLETIQTDYVNCLPYQTTSLADIQRSLGVTGGRLFNSILSVQRLFPAGKTMSSIALKTVDVEDPSEFDIVLNIGDSTELVDLNLTYNTSLLSEEQASRLLASLTKTIDSVVDALEKPLGTIDILTAEDQQQILSWNSNGEAPKAVSDVIDNLIDAHLGSMTDKLAISGWDASLTYAELDELTTNLAEHLITKHNVMRNDLIPFCTEKSAWGIVTMLGILKAGAAFVPLDPKHPPERLAYIVQKVKAPLVILSEKYEPLSAHLTDPTRRHMLLTPTTLRGLKQKRGSRTVDDPTFKATRSSEDLAYCLFTSGSTGTPKGVLVQHEALSSSCTMHGEAFGFNSQSRALQFSSYTFDVSLTDIFTTLVFGGTICVPSDQQRMDTEELHGFINEHGVNIGFLTPSFLGLMDPVKVPNFETILIGGEAVGQQLVDRWQDGTRLIHNSYGPTECCIFCVGYDYTHGKNHSAGKSVIGRAIGSIAWIGDPRDPNKLLPIGAVGELLIEGPILAKGYLGDNDKTAAAFITPTWAGKGRRVYRTGDSVRYQDDGTIEYIGRRDNQVKLRGQRLELGEIEQRLLQHPDVQQCVVLLPKEGVCSQKIVAVMTLFGGKDTATQIAGVLRAQPGDSTGIEVLSGSAISSRVISINDYMVDALPTYMVPSSWIIADAFPLLSSGKADRRLISASVLNMSQELLERSIDISTPGGLSTHGDEEVSPLAKTLREIWSDVLNVPEQRINPSTGSFIRHGGDSISAMEVVAQSRAKGIPLMIEDLLKAPSVQKLAANIEPKISVQNTSSTPDAPLNSNAQIDEHDDNEVVLFGLSPIQRMFTKLQPGENHYNQSFLVKVSSDRPKLSEDGARSALNAIVRTHAMLRARFQKLGKSFKQWIEPTVEGSYTLDMLELPASATFPSEAIELMDDTQSSFDIAEGPVFGGNLITIGNDQYIFLAAHHLVVDLVSWRIILKDLEDYLTKGSISDYRTLSFEKWCGLLNAHRKVLNEAPDSHLPFNVPKADYDYWGMKGVKNFARDFIDNQFVLSTQATEALLGPCNDAFGTEALDLFMAALFQSFEATFTDRGLPSIHNEGHGREPWDGDIDLSRTVGWFTTCSPLWVQSAGCDRDVLQYVKKIKDMRRRVPKKGFSYFTSLDLDKEPFNIEISFNYFGAFQQLDRSDAMLNQVHWSSIGVSPGEVGHNSKKFALIEITAAIEDNKLVFTFGFNKKIKHQDQVQQWASNCRQSLEHIARNIAGKEMEHTITDFEHLPDTYDLQGLRESTLKDLGLSEANVEDIYPCSLAQQGMLLTQTKDPEMYWFRSIYEVQTAGPISGPITTKKLSEAWSAVVKRHPVLRTVFIEQNSTDGLFDQLVIRNYQPDVSEVRVSATMPEEELVESLRIGTIAHELLSFRKPQHQLRIVHQVTTGRIFCSFLFSHAVVDASSMTILLRDFGLACQSRLLDAEGLQYKNYITYLKSRDLASDISYWKQSLEGITPCFLPTEQESGLERSLRRAEMPMHNARGKGPIQSAQVQSLARELGVSPFTLLQVTWALTVREFSGQDREDAAFGVVTSGRDLPVHGIRDIAGPFVNILTSRVMLPDDKSIAQIAETFHNTFIDNMAHQTSSLAEVAHELGTGPLFNTGITMQKTLGSSTKPGVSFHAVGGQDPTEFDAVVHAIDDGDYMRIHMTYWADKIPEERADDMADTFTSILSQIIENPDVKPLDLEMISQEDLTQLWSWNKTLTPNCGMRIEEMISRQAAAQPFKEAVWSTEESLNYQQVDQLSTRLALNHLTDVCREDIIPLCFEKSIWTIIATIAVFKAGGTVVILDPSFPIERLKSMMETVKPRMILASPTHTKMCINDLGIRTVTITKETIGPQPPFSKLKAKIGTVNKSATDAAYIVFTSGSTGTPKGSVTIHGSFCTAMQNYPKAIGQFPESRVLQFASYSFDTNFLEILGSLMIGATVCVPTDKERSNNLIGFMNRAKVTFALITPTLASLLTPEDVPTLDVLALCGEPMTASHISKWADKIRLVNAYGPSECCVGSAANNWVKTTDSPKNIGWAVASCYWVVNPKNHHRLSRIGSVGELLIEGPILARHYLNNEAKTKEAFITNPEWAGTRPGRGTRLYKTGDLVYQLPNGSFQYVERKDTQAKLRGQRLELGDIEHAFKTVVPEIESVAAEIIKADARAARLVLFYSTTPVEPMLTSAEILAKMGQKIPSYMVPAALIPLQDMPLMPSGKIDRKKLRTMGAGLPTHTEKRSGRVPETEMEIALASLWKDVVNSTVMVDEGGWQILADDNFFQVGGDSFTAMKLVTKARTRGINISVATVMQAPKLADMAKKATRSSQGTAQHEAAEPQTTVPFSLIRWSAQIAADVSRQCCVPIERIEDVYACTPLQEGVFVLSIKRPGTYVARHCYQLPADIDIRKYKEAWNAVYESSLALRTHIVHLENCGLAADAKSGLYQAVIKKPLVWQYHDSLDECLATEMKPSLGTSMTQFSIVEEMTGTKYIVMTMHHASYDAASLRQLMNNAEAVYKGHKMPASRPFRNFIRHLQATKASENKDFWKRYLKGSKASTFPAIPAGHTPAADATVDYKITVPDIKSEVHTFPTIIRAAWSMVLAHHQGGSDVVVGEILSGRNGFQDDDDADVDGPLITTIPARFSWKETDKIQNMLDTIQTRAVEVIPYQQAGLHNIKRFGADAAAACNFTCLIAIQTDIGGSGEDDGIGIQFVKVPSAPAMDLCYPMSVEFILLPEDKLQVYACHDEKLIDGNRVRTMVSQFVHVLSQLCEGGQKILEEIDVANAPVLDIKNSKSEEEEELKPWEVVEEDDLAPPAMLNVEQEIRAMWADILQTDATSFGLGDNFFHIGGDSISAMRLVTMASRKDIDLTVADIFSNPTLKEMCAFAEQAIPQPLSTEADEPLRLPPVYGRPGSRKGSIATRKGSVMMARKSSIAPPVIIDYETVMQGLWADILDVQHVGHRDNFFHIGGDSISAMRLVTNAARKDIDLTVADIFSNPTLEALCNFIRAGIAPMPAPEPMAHASHLQVPASSGMARQVSPRQSAPAAMQPASHDMVADMQAMWAEILEVPHVESTDNFFTIGGDSISAMRLVTAAARKDIDITVVDLFSNPVLEDLCAFLSKEMTGAQPAPIRPVSPVSRAPVPTRVAPAPIPVYQPTETPVRPAPAALQPTSILKPTPRAAAALPPAYRPGALFMQTPTQDASLINAVCKQLSVFPADIEDVYPATDYQAWAISHGLMRSRGNTNYFLFQLEGNLDTYRLEQACRRMVESNPILRTIFTVYGRGIMQVVMRSYQLEFLRYGKEHGNDDRFVRWLVEQDTQRSNTLAQPIVRFKLLLHQAGHYVLVMRISHAQYDGMSLPLLLDDLKKCYAGVESIERPPFSRFIHAVAAREEDSIRFWRRQLEGSTMTQVIQHAGPAYNHNVDTIRSRNIPPMPAHVAGMSQATIVKAAWALVLARASGQRDIVFGNLIFGRTIPVAGIQNISGPCLNMIPVRIRLDEVHGVYDLLRLVQEQQLAAMPYETLGFRRLIENCTDWPRWTRFSSVVQHQSLGHDPSAEFAFADDVRCQIGCFGPAYDSSDLWVQTTPHADETGVEVEIGFCNAVVSTEMADELLDMLCSTLVSFSCLGADGDRPLNGLVAGLMGGSAPMLPRKSSLIPDQSPQPLVNEVWDSVLPGGAGTGASADTPYFEIWGDEIAAVRFVEEYADRGIVLDVEDVMEHPTKGAQMLLAARMLADETRRASVATALPSFFSFGSGPSQSASQSGGDVDGDATTAVSSAASSIAGGRDRDGSIGPGSLRRKRTTRSVNFSSNNSPSMTPVSSRSVVSTASSRRQGGSGAGSPGDYPRKKHGLHQQHVFEDYGFPRTKTSTF